MKPRGALKRLTLGNALTTRRLAAVLLLAVMAAGSADGQEREAPLQTGARDPAAPASVESANAAFNAGMALYNAAEYADAAARFAQAADTYGRIGAEVAIYREYALSWAGLSHFNLGDLEESLRCYDEALALARELEDAGETARLSSSVGSVYVAQGDLQKALRLFEESVALNDSLGRADFVAYDLNNTGNVYEMLDRRPEAVPYYEEALSVMEETADPETVILQAVGLAQVYDALGRHREEIAAHEKALAWARELGDPEYEAVMLGNLGLCHTVLSEYETALGYYDEARSMFLVLGDEAELSRLYANMSVLCLDTGRFDTALEYIEKAFAISERIGLEEEIPKQLTNFGQVYEAWGRFDRAHEYYSEALVLLEAAGREQEAAALQNNLGAMYEAWGRYGTAVEHYEKALRLYEEYEEYEGIAVVLNNLGQIYRAWQRYEWAREAYQQSLEIHEALGLTGGMAIALSNLGEVHRALGEYDQALEYYDRALEIDRADGRESKVALRLNNIGLVHSARGDTAAARRYFLEALQAFESTGQSRKAATALNNVGVSYYDEEDFERAAEYLERSVEKKEILRLTAAGDIRRDYLASQIATYRWLASAYVNAGRPAEAFDANELSSAKYLLEQIGERLEGSGFGFSGIRSYRRKLGPDQAVISFVNLDWHTPDEIRSSHLVVDAMTATSEGLHAVEIDKSRFLRNMTLDLGEVIDSHLENARGFVVKATEEPADGAGPADFERVIAAYRRLLAKPRLYADESEALERMSRQLYDLLFGPIEERLAGRTELLIIPEGALAFIPFETLKMPDGRYLVEKYVIRYAQSLGVLEIIERRVAGRREQSAGGSPGSRGGLLAFGGAVYEPRSYRADMFDSEREFDAFKQHTLSAMETGAGARGAYEALGLAGWANLPGTLAEVRRIGAIVEDSTVYTGRQVEEAFVKKLSANGLLRRYRVVHFATHGIVVPDFPELSAIVLSLTAQGAGADQDTGTADGYLTMKEIAGLDLDADFVNLSACETGLGALYSGEGVVGLTQAFLVAGANGLSVSLWQVADESTMKLMVGLYELVQKTGMAYHEAMAEMKRRFIHQGPYGSPFYWAPFVYYGM